MQAAGTAQADIDHMKKASGILQMNLWDLARHKLLWCDRGHVRLPYKSRARTAGGHGGPATRKATRPITATAMQGGEKRPRAASKSFCDSGSWDAWTPARHPSGHSGHPDACPGNSSPSKSPQHAGRGAGETCGARGHGGSEEPGISTRPVRNTDFAGAAGAEERARAARRRQKERRREERRLQLQRRLEKRAKKGLAGRERGAGGAGVAEGHPSGMIERAAGKSEIDELRETLLDELRKPRKRRVLEPDSRIDWTLFEGYQVYTQRDVGQRLGKLRRQKRQERAAKRAAQLAEESGAVPLTPPDFSMPDVDQADLPLAVPWAFELPQRPDTASRAASRAARWGPRKRSKRLLKSLGLGAGLGGLGTSEDPGVRALQQLVQWQRQSAAEAAEVDIVEVQPEPGAEVQAASGEPDSASAPESKEKAEALAPASGSAERTRMAREKYRVALEKFSTSSAGTRSSGSSCSALSLRHGPYSNLMVSAASGV